MEPFLLSLAIALTIANIFLYIRSPRRLMTTCSTHQQFNDFAEYISEQLFQFYIKTNENGCIDFSNYINVIGNNKSINLLLTCQKQVVDILPSDWYVDEIDCLQLPRLLLPLTKTSRPLKQFIKFYINSHKTYTKRFFDSLNIQLTYRTKYGTISYNSYSLYMEDTIVRFDWILPTGIELLTLLDKSNA